MDFKATTLIGALVLVAEEVTWNPATPIVGQISGPFSVTRSKMKLSMILIQKLFFVENSLFSFFIVFKSTYFVFRSLKLKTVGYVKI